MAKKMKLDTSKLKQFVLEKGERVGLAVAAAVMVLLLGYGLITGLGASSPADNIKSETQKLATRIDSSRPPPAPIEETKPNQTPGAWPRTPRYEQFASVGNWFDAGAAGESKSQNPTVLPAGDVVAGGEVKNIQLNYVLGGALTLDFDATRETLKTVKPSGAGGTGPAAAAGADDFARLLHPTRMIVVSTTFPYREQLEVVRKALRKANASELFAADADPKFFGLNILRWEILPGGKTSEPQAVYEFDADKGRTIVALPETKSLLTTGEYDKALADQVAEYLVPGLATPLPKFMNATYPKLALAGIEVKEGDDDGTGKPDPAKTQPGGMRPPRQQLPGGSRPQLPGGGRSAPMVSGAAADDALMIDGRPLPISKLADKDAPLLEKLKGEFNLFDAYGRPEEVDANKAQPMAPAPPPVVRRAPDAKIPEKLLVRFFDADIQPGKTYQYSIQVRMANPNFGKKGDVAYVSLAEIKELVSPWTITPTITLGDEYFAYGVDTGPKQLESKAIGPKGTEKEPVTVERTAIQIQRWVDKVGDGGKDVVADWVVAERLLVHRGEILAREGVEVELPVWNKYRGTSGQFELASSGARSSGKQGSRSRQAAPVDFFPRDRATVTILVDFVGGKRVNDDSSTELLILRPDGKLVVRTSREDTDPESATGAERTRRYEAWHSRISSLRPNNGKAPGMPNQP